MASLKPKAGEGTTTEAFSFVPSKIHVDHANNFSRADRYSVPAELAPHVEGTSFCFTLAEVEQRLSEFDRDGEQITPGTVYLTKTRDAFLVDGYLRHAAWLLAEARFVASGEVWTNTGTDGAAIVVDGKPAKRKLDKLTAALTKCKRGVLNVFKAQKVAQPKRSEDWAALRQRNFSENDTRKPLTPIDRAYFARRVIKQFKQEGLKDKQAKARTALEMGLTAVRQLDRYLSLLALPPAKQDALHSGAISMSQALAKASKTAEGTGKGKRPGTPHANLRRAHENRDTRPSPTSNLDAYQVARLGARLGGIVEPKDITPDPQVDAWELWFDASKDAIVKPPKPPKKSRKKAAKKLGE